MVGNFKILFFAIFILCRGAGAEERSPWSIVGQFHIVDIGTSVSRFPYRSGPTLSLDYQIDEFLSIGLNGEIDVTSVDLSGKLKNGTVVDSQNTDIYSSLRASILFNSKTIISIFKVGFDVNFGPALAIYYAPSNDGFGFNSESGISASAGPFLEATLSRHLGMMLSLDTELIDMGAVSLIPITSLKIGVKYLF
jgi:hypothetical protein